MQHSCLLLALVASVTASNTAQLKRSTEEDLTLLSREPVRSAFVEVGQRETLPSGKWRYKRDDDDPDPFDRLHRIFDDPHHDDHEDDEDDEDKDEKPSPSNHDNDEYPGGMNGGTIAGAVVGSIFGFFIILGICYYLCVRPRRSQNDMVAARKEMDIESTHPPTTPPRSPNYSNSSSEHIHWVRTPYPRNVPSVQTTSTISGLALPTPAMAHSPSIAAASPPLAPAQHHTLSEKPPAYAAVIALQSSEPQPEATAYQMGQVPVPTEPPMYQLPVVPAPGATDMKGEPISRY